MGKANKFEDWERIFILLTYPMETAETLAKYLKRHPISIRTLFNRLFLKKKCKISIGELYGNWKVLSKSNYRTWNCECSSCKRTKHFFTKQLIEQKYNQCICNREYTEKIMPQWYFTHLKQSAEKRNIEFLLSKEQISNKMIEQDYKCALTGIPLRWGLKERKGEKKLTASLDRIDSSKGYIEGNVQWVHRKINFMKWNLLEEDFKYYCRKVTEYNIEKIQKEWRCQ